MLGATAQFPMVTFHNQLMAMAPLSRKGEKEAAPEATVGWAGGRQTRGTELGTTGPDSCRAPPAINGNTLGHGDPAPPAPGLR